MQVTINDISEGQLRKLERGLPVQFRYNQIMDQTISNRHIKVHPETHKRIVNAHRNKKGIRVKLTMPEIEASGEGLRSMWEWLKRQAPKALSVAKKVVGSDFYQKNVRPELHKLVTGLESTLPVNPVTNIARAGIEELGEKSGAYGLKKPRSKKSMSKPKTKRVIGTAVTPMPPTDAHIGGLVVPVGGSFLI